MIDLNQGVEMRRHSTGMEVYMYVKRPGEYLTAHETAVPDVIAKEAGFPTEKLGKEKRKRELQAEAITEIEQRFGDTGDAVDELVAEAGGFKLIHIGMERHNVTDPDGNVLNPRPLTGPEARSLFGKLGGKEAKAAIRAALDIASHVEVAEPESGVAK
jgi:hypothetical protein